MAVGPDLLRGRRHARGRRVDLGAGEAAVGRRAGLRRPRRAPELLRASGRDLRHAASGGAPLQHAAEGRSLRPDRYEVHRRPRRILDRVERSAHVHVQAAPRREVPRWEPADVRRREGVLRSHHLPAAHRRLESSGRLPSRGSGGGSLARHRGLPAEVARGVLHRQPVVTLEESPWTCSIGVTPNQQKRPFDDKRVRRALTLALDRWNGSKALSRIALVKDVAGIQVPGTPWATPPEELTKLAGYGSDIAAARAEARRLLKEAGAEGLSFTLLNRAVPMPYEPVGVWLIDQWRQIGVTVKQTVLESAAWLQAQKNSEFEVSVTATCNSIVEPDMDLHWFLTTSPWNIGRHKDTMLDELYQKQSRAVDPEERKKYLRAFEKRLYDEEVDYILAFQWHRIIPHSSRVHGWTVTPSHYLNQQLDTVWLSE